MERFRVNWEGYIRERRVFLILTALAALADAASTVYFMLRAGPDAEGHPQKVIRQSGWSRRSSAPYSGPSSASCASSPLSWF
ncbi:MAG: hypothetical protein ACYSWW_23620 [Planctomycetota bacterium]